jgi:hypothetical protein
MASHAAGNDGAASGGEAAKTHPVDNSPSAMPVIEIAEGIHGAADTLHSALENTNKAAKVYNGMQAYRRYNWLLNKPALNASGNFRGMVIDANAKQAFNVTIENAEKLEALGRYLIVAGAAIELAKNVSSTRFGSDPYLNTQKVLVDVDSAIIRTLGGFVTGPVHILAKTMTVVCGATGVQSRYVQRVSQMDYSLSHTLETVTDPNAMLTFINTRLVFVR